MSSHGKKQGEYSVYSTNHLVGTGDAVIITSQGKANGSRFAEYHILLPHTRPCTRKSQPFSVGPSAQELSEEGLRGHILSYARNWLQDHVEQKWLETHDGPLPVVTVADADDSLLRRVRFAGLCEHELSSIATQTSCSQLKDAIRRLNRVPVITPTG